MAAVKSKEPGIFRWFANGEELETSHDHQIISDGFKSALLIRCKVANNSEYAVEFTNSLGIIHSKTTVVSEEGSDKMDDSAMDVSGPSQVTVIDREQSSVASDVSGPPPRFIETLSVGQLNEGETLEAKVTVAMDTPPCSFEWFLQVI